MSAGRLGRPPRSAVIPSGLGQIAGPRERGVHLRVEVGALKRNQTGAAMAAE